MSRSLSQSAGVPLGNVIVKNVTAETINDNECLTASLWILGMNSSGEYGVKCFVLAGRYS